MSVLSNDPIEQQRTIRDHFGSSVQIVEKGSETSAILQAIAALAEGIRARDKQWDAVSEQIRIGFERENKFADWYNTDFKLIMGKLMAIEERLPSKLFAELASIGEWAAQVNSHLEAIRAKQQKTRRAKKRKR